jgi:hypothetical protein
MAPIITRKDQPKNLITHVCTGRISVDEILTLVQAYFSGEVIKKFENPDPPKSGASRAKASEDCLYQMIM